MLLPLPLRLGRRLLPLQLDPGLEPPEECPALVPLSPLLRSEQALLASSPLWVGRLGRRQLQVPLLSLFLVLALGVQLMPRASLITVLCRS